MRICRDCPAEVTARSPLAVRCPSCQHAHKLKCARLRYAVKHDRVRICTDCGASLEDRYPNAEYCTDCRDRRRLEAQRRHDRTRTQDPDRIVQRWRSNGRRDPGPVFLRVPDQSVFDDWLAETIMHPPPPLPVLDREPASWRPLSLEGREYLCNSP